jgi:hypothetical protein
VRPGRRASVATISIVLEESTPTRLLIRVKTVDDSLSQACRPVERAFFDPQMALAYLDDWIDRWSGDGTGP